jgi:hypothetical protein
MILYVRRGVADWRHVQRGLARVVNQTFYFPLSSRAMQYSTCSLQPAHLLTCLLLYAVGDAYECIERARRYL